ncbi:MAG: hypothetical protein K2X32_01715 [Phycisphaerales bacterium]|nr:hypothetical protein [Phycisphaerales bacterium]
MQLATLQKTLPVSSAIVPLKLGDAVVHLPLTGTTEELGRARASASDVSVDDEEDGARSSAPSDIDLSLVERRCRLKAASCRLFIERRAAAADPDAEREVLDRLNDMIAKAKAMESCFLWVFWRNQAQPDDAILARIADCYDAQADAVALLQRVDAVADGRRAEDEESAFHLLAEANSALRVALADTWLSDDDRDQAETHVWLRRETAERRVFIERHMTGDDPADPTNAADLRSRIKAQGKRLDEREAAAKKVKNALGQIKYHAGQLTKGRPEEAPAHWTKISDAVKRLEGMGVSTTDRRIAEAVGSVAAAAWPGPSADADHMTGVITRALMLGKDSEKTAQERASAEPREWSSSVLSVRGLLRGKRMVIIGGERNAEAVQRLTQAFELKDAEWVDLTEHGPGTPMRGPIYRPDTAVVIVIIKLTGHLHAEEAREYASAAGKPCVMLSGGYNPERVAAEIIEQASTRLK